MTSTRALVSAAVLSVAGPLPAALAEPVAVEAGSQSGAGWMFGSRQTGDCWVVTAAHTVMRGGVVEPFLWRLIDGRVGGVDSVLTDETHDVAFGRVTGLATSECRSRLSVRNTEALLRSRPQLWLVVPVSTSARAEEVQATTFSASAFRVDAIREDSRDRIQRGVSGAPILYRDPAGGDIPVGLVTHAVPGVAGAVFATRFDAIEALFSEREALERSPDHRQPTPTGGPVGFSIEGATGRSRSAEFTASALLVEGGCWLAAPVPPGRAITVDISPAPEVISGVEFRHEQGCGEPPESVHISVPSGERTWRTLASCSGVDGTLLCSIPPSVYSRLRLTLVRRDGAEIGARQIELITSDLPVRPRSN